MKTELNWISSAGGPLILISETLRSEWNGIGTKEEFLNGTSDYDRACEIDDYTGLISVGKGEALILGDMPSHTASIVLNSDSVLLIRWIWAENEKQVAEALESFQIEHHEWTEAGQKIRFDGNKISVFDSALAGDEIEEKLEMAVDSGTYTVSTFSFEPTTDLNLFLILLSRTDG